MANVWGILAIGVAVSFFISRRRKREEDEEGKGPPGFLEEFEIEPPPPPLPPMAPLPLSGLTFSVKDVFDIESRVTGFGNPVWADTHQPAKCTASAVLKLVNAGARCLGKTIMDELAYGITGECKHYGTPANPAAPGRIPGGSSSGSAVSVAAKVVNFALGTDTCGNLRIPAAYCGILGFRPSHGLVSSEGVVPLAPSLDAVGWFAREAELLRKVGTVLLPKSVGEARSIKHLFIAEDYWELTTAPKDMSILALRNAASQVFSGVMIQNLVLGDYISKKVPSLSSFFPEEKGGNKALSTSSKNMVALADAMLAIQGHEFKEQHSGWLREAKFPVGPESKDQMKSVLAKEYDKITVAQKVKEELRTALGELLKGDGVLCIPTASALPPKTRSYSSVLSDIRARAMQLVALASMGGVPQVSMPAGVTESKPAGLPLALSLLGMHGNDLTLLDAVCKLMPVMKEELKTLTESEAKGIALPDRSQKQAAEAAKEKGNAAFRENNFAKAVAYYTEAIKLDPKNPLYYNNRAMANLQLDNFREAEEDCSITLSLDKKNVKAWLRRGTAREFLAHYADAVQDFTQALVYEPTNKTALEAVKRMKLFVLK
ncbi:hypothetical protein CBR_g36926 [Chara braunii]|uniref:Amidase domain-containing protein n=1 Tax=Chara braunii TaxID=69332 RepID=A0A388JZF3_CHABU|nr:hypothetical protein CBR_g36926 [Chara braunii]|eukprot:GBG63157.1 hypothetical protein CBR_g36926 [Chara braunii]